MANGRTEEALDIMAKYHGESGRIVQLEYKKMAGKLLAHRSLDIKGVR
jgi:hypothetical protein